MVHPVFIIHRMHPFGRQILRSYAERRSNSAITEGPSSRSASLNLNLMAETLFAVISHLDAISATDSSSRKAIQTASDSGMPRGKTTSDRDSGSQDLPRFYLLNAPSRESHPQGRKLLPISQKTEDAGRKSCSACDDSRFPTLPLHVQAA